MMQFTETNLGYFLETSEVRILFGGVKANLINVKASFPETEFIRVKQTHGDVSVETPSLREDYAHEADAHYTSKPNTGVCISTADCIPVFLFDKKRKVIAGIHAGWRGVANRIVPKTIHKLLHHGSKAEDLQVFIGPHIQKVNFEVGADVRDSLLISASLTVQSMTAAQQKDFLHPVSAEKSLVDLNRLMHLQLDGCLIPAENILDLHMDTFSDSRFHSHRRDKEQAGRQLSFICRA